MSKIILQRYQKKVEYKKNQCEGIRGPRGKKGSLFNSIMKHLKGKSNHDLLHGLFHEYFMNLYPSMVGNYEEDQKEYQRKNSKVCKDIEIILSNNIVGTIKYLTRYVFPYIFQKKKK